MEWVRGNTIGRGSFGTVSLAVPKSQNSISSPFVVKSSDVSTSNSLKNEKDVLTELGNHPQIIKFLGDSISYEKNNQLYNIFFEFAENGSLADQMKVSGGKFDSFDVKRYTRAILKGLDYIHESGFVHGDIKLQNILSFEDGEVKIGDFGLARHVSENKTGLQLRGTPLYMSPEIVAGGELGSPADVWALGCAVVEMVSGKSAWKCSPESDVSSLLYRIGVAGESPVVPESLCCEGKDFVEKCFIKDPSQRWTAQMLLDHPFVSGFDNGCSASVSPRCPFDFPDWESSEMSFGSGTIESSESFEFSDESEILGWNSIWLSRFEQELVSDHLPNWNDEDCWITVR